MTERRIFHAVRPLLAVAAVALVACASTPTRESMGEYMDDALITSKVRTALVADSQVHSTDIKVETFKGTVQLSGFAGSPDERARAAESREPRGRRQGSEERPPRQGRRGSFQQVNSNPKGTDMTLDRRILAVVLVASLGTLLTACQREGTSSMDRTSSAQQPSQGAAQPGGAPPSSSAGSQSSDSNTNTAAAPSSPSDNSAPAPSSSEDNDKAKKDTSKEKSPS